MKATGIVRRIDDLGRVVIPKEIRRTMRIREGAPLEIYTDREGEVIFKKYSPLGDLTAFAGQYAETLYKACGLSVAVCDRDAVIACAGIPKKEYQEKPLSEGVESIMESRSLYRRAENDSRFLTREGQNHVVSCAMPILSEGDIVGCVVSLIPNEPEESGQDRRPPDPRHPRETGTGPDVETKLIQTAALFLGKQLEE